MCDRARPAGAPTTATVSLSVQGLKPHHVFDAKQPFTVRYIMGVAGIPKGFDRVRDIVAGNDAVRLVSDSGKAVETPVNGEFVCG